MKSLTEIPRSELIVGEKYYFDDRRKPYGVFESRSEEKDETVFKPVSIHDYALDTDGKIRFEFEGDGFLPKLK
jgi:hypothetical protein